MQSTQPTARPTWGGLPNDLVECLAALDRLPSTSTPINQRPAGTEEATR